MVVQTSQLGQIKILEDKVCVLKEKVAVQDSIINNLVSNNLNHLQPNMRLMLHISRSEDQWALNEICLHSIHWGQGGLETSENILSTLQALVEGTCHLPANNKLGTFQMYPYHVFDLEPVGTFMQHLECNFSMYLICNCL